MSRNLNINANYTYETTITSLYCILSQDNASSFLRLRLPSFRQRCDGCLDHWTGGCKDFVMRLTGNDNYVVSQLLRVSTFSMNRQITVFPSVEDGDVDVYMETSKRQGPASFKPVPKLWSRISAACAMASGVGILLLWQK